MHTKITKNLKNAFLVVLKLGYLLIFQNLFRWSRIIFLLKILSFTNLGAPVIVRYYFFKI